MKKNIFKKVVASLATVVMAAGLFTAMPAEEAKAAEVSQENPITYTFHFQKPSEWEKVYVKACVGNWEYPDSDTVGNYKGYTGPDATTAVLEEDTNNPGWYTVTVKTGVAWGVNLIFANTGWHGQTKNIQIAYNMPAGEYEFWYTMDNETMIIENCRLGLSEYESSYADGDSKPYVEMDELAVAPAGWVKATDAEIVAQVESAIDEALALDATKDNKEKYDTAKTKYNSLTDAQKALVDADKVEELNAGIEAIEAILEAEKAAEDAKYTGKITIYAKTPGWEKVSLYGWTIDDSTRIFGDWPGNKKLTEMELNPGWYSCTLDMTEAIGVIFNNDNNKEQTGDWENMKPGEYWLDFSQVEGTPDGENTKYVIDESIVSKTAPTGWKTEAAQEVEQENTNNNNNTNNTTNNKTEEKKGVTVEVALGADAKWDKVFVHAWGEGFETKWPGVEMTKKDGKWYATLDTTLTKLSFVVSNGNGEQTVDIKEVEGKEVKITLGAKNADGKFEGTAAGSTGSTGATGTQKPGDVAPVAIMLAVAALAAVMVVASKKKVVCE